MNNGFGKATPGQGKLRFMEELCQKIRKGDFFRSADSGPKVSGNSESMETDTVEESEKGEEEKKK